ncbi:MAG: hypothetical protein ACYC8S_02755 [Minisyncoccota bacterium]
MTSLYTSLGVSPRNAREGFLQKARELHQQDLGVHHAAELLREEYSGVRVAPTHPPELILATEGTEVCFRWVAGKQG